MAYVPVESLQGLISLTNIDTSANRTIPRGTIVRGVDTTTAIRSYGEFIYLNGVASNVVGALATWNPVAGTTTLVPSTAKLGYPVAVSLTANTTTTSYSWYQISGVATISKAATVVGLGARLWAQATGVVNAVSVAGKGVWGAIAVNSTLSAATFAKVLIQRPFMEPLAT